MIQIHIDRNKTGEAMKYLDMAINKDPDNATYYFVRGKLFEQTNQTENAIESYQKSIEIDEEYFNSHYNISVLYYSEGVKQIEVANEVPQEEEERFNKEVAKADEWFSKALPYIEKSHKMKSDDTGTKELLKSIYYRLNMMDKYKSIGDS